jgi:hypothetical protein
VKRKQETAPFSLFFWWMKNPSVHMNFISWNVVVNKTRESMNELLVRLLQVFLLVPLFVLRLPLPLQRAVWRSGPRYVMALHTGKCSSLHVSHLSFCNP